MKQSINDVWDAEQVREELQMPTSCAELQCSGSARCVVDERTGHARCRCPLGTAGIYCEQGQCMSRRSLITETITAGHINSKLINSAVVNVDDMQSRNCSRKLAQENRHRFLTPVFRSRCARNKKNGAGFLEPIFGVGSRLYVIGLKCVRYQLECS